MSGRPRQVSDAGILEIRTWHQARSALATPKEMCKRHRISSGTLSTICRGYIYKVPARG